MEMTIARTNWAMEAPPVKHEQRKFTTQNICIPFLHTFCLCNAKKHACQATFFGNNYYNHSLHTSQYQNQTLRFHILHSLKSAIYLLCSRIFPGKTDKLAIYHLSKREALLIRI